MRQKKDFKMKRLCIVKIFIIISSIRKQKLRRKRIGKKYFQTCIKFKIIKIFIMVTTEKMHLRKE